MTFNEFFAKYFSLNTTFLGFFPLHNFSQEYVDTCLSLQGDKGPQELYLQTLATLENSYGGDVKAFSDDIDSYINNIQKKIYKAKETYQYFSFEKKKKGTPLKDFSDGNYQGYDLTGGHMQLLNRYGIITPADLISDQHFETNKKIRCMLTMTLVSNLAHSIHNEMTNIVFSVAENIGQPDFYINGDAIIWKVPEIEKDFLTEKKVNLDGWEFHTTHFTKKSYVLPSLNEPFWVVETIDGHKRYWAENKTILDTKFPEFYNTVNN